MRGVAPQDVSDEALAPAADAPLSPGHALGKHDELKPLLSKLGLKKYAKAFAKHEINSIALLRSMAAMQSLRANLKELGMEDAADVALLQGAVLSQANSGGLHTGSDHTAEDEPSSDDGGLEDSEDEASKAPADPHRVHLSKKEFDEIMDWSDDEDMTTPQGRFNRRKKKEGDFQQSHTMQYMMRPGEEGSVTDVSKGPRNILKKLLQAAPPSGFQNPVDGFEVDLAYTARIRPTVEGPYGPTCGPIEELFDERTEADPLHATIGAGDFYLGAFEEAVATMRQGERASFTIHPRVAYGAAGVANGVGTALAPVPPNAFLEYEVRLLKVYEVSYLADGAVVKKTLTMPEYASQPEESSEVTVRWSGKLAPGGKIFKPACRQTFTLTDPTLPKWWKTVLMGNPNNAGGGRGMGEGEVSVFTVPPSLGFGSVGYSKWGVPPDATLQIKVELKSFVYVEDISTAKDGAAIKRVEVRGTGESTPHKGDECACSFRIFNAVTKETYQEKPESVMVLGEMPERQRQAMRLLSAGAYADRVLELLLSQMHSGETSEVRCKQSFIGGDGDDIVVRCSLSSHVKLFVCPDTDSKVEVRVEIDPTDTRGPNEESTCGVRYTVRAISREISREGDASSSQLWGPLMGGLLGERGEVVEVMGAGERLFRFVQSTKAAGVLPCVDHAVKQMRKGGKAWVTSPPEYAYGSADFTPLDGQEELAQTWKDWSVQVTIVTSSPPPRHLTSSPAHLAPPLLLSSPPPHKHRWSWS